MQSVILSNPIYQHSGETEKDCTISQQASINEDLEQRRRQLDRNGEELKAIIAKDVANMVDQYGGRVHLKQTTYVAPAEPILLQAQATATSVLSSAFEAGKSLLHSASVATSAATTAISNATSAATTAVSDATKGVADTASHLGHDAADYVSSATKDAANYVSHAAHEAAVQASDISKKVVETTSSAATAVGQKTKDLAEGAVDKAYEIADNINHFTTLVGVLAEEENERARRLISGDEARAAANAFRVSELIRDLGIAFYKQTPNLNYTTKVLEEAERRWRLNSSHSSLAESHAHSVGKLVSNNLQSFMPRYQWVRAHIASIEEKERIRRLNDCNETYAILNALKVSGFISDLGLGFYKQIDAFSRSHSSYSTTLLEELERKDRIRNDKLHHAQDSAHLLMDVVANNMEKFNYTTRQAAQFANEFASLLGNATKKVAAEFSVLTQDFAKSAATRVKAVAHDLANFSSVLYVIALEEKERARRLSDPSEIIAINNAWIQSGLIRELEGLYRSSHRALYPIGLLEEQERAWRLASVTPVASRKISAFVLANSSKFELAALRLGEIETAKLTAAHSRLNPKAPAFVPHQSFVKVEPAVIVSIPRASGAQF